MTPEEIKDEMIEIETIQIAIDDKLHRIQVDQMKIKKGQNNLQTRILTLKRASECGQY